MGVVAQSPEPGAHDKNAQLFKNYLPKITVFVKINLEYNIKPS